MSRRTLFPPSKIITKIISILLLTIFTISSVWTPDIAQAQAAQTVLNLSAPGVMVSASADFVPVMVKGITLYPDNPLQFDFILDQGDTSLNQEVLDQETIKMAKYFLASLTVPEKDLWVNLSPYEQDRIIDDDFGQTEMGRDLLAQDYVLKQLASSLMYPENELGKKFWNRVYERLVKQYGSTDVPLNTFSKVWIVPARAKVYETGNSAYVIDSHLKVMLEEDYLAMSQQEGQVSDTLSQENAEVMREVLIPEIEREVNKGQHFAQLRQIYHAMILATWYKSKFQKSLLGKVYIDQNKTQGINNADTHINQKIYDQYIDAFKIGVYDYIKEDYDPVTQETVPRKYFSGGFSLKSTVFGALSTLLLATSVLTDADAAVARVAIPNTPHIKTIELQSIDEQGVQGKEDSAMSTSIGNLDERVIVHEGNILYVRPLNEEEFKKMFSEEVDPLKYLVLRLDETAVLEDLTILEIDGKTLVREDYFEAKDESEFNQKQEELKKQLLVNAEAEKEYFKEVEKIVNKNQSVILQAISNETNILVGEMTKDATVVMSSEDAILRPALVRGDDGSVKFYRPKKINSTLMSRTYSDDLDLLFAPIEPGKVAHHLTVILPSSASLTKKTLEEALEELKVDMRQIDSANKLLSSDRVVMNIDSYSFKQTDGGDIQIDVDLWYDLNTEGIQITSDVSDLKNLPFLRESRQEVSHVFHEKLTDGDPLNVMINGGRGAIGNLTVRSLFLLLERLNSQQIKLVLINATDVDGMIDALQHSTVHGPFGDKFKRGEDKEKGEWFQFSHTYIDSDGNQQEFTSEKIYVINDRGDVKNLPLKKYGIHIAVDAVGGRTKSFMKQYIKAGARRSINTAPIKEEDDGTIGKDKVFGVNQDLEFDECTSAASCTTNSLASVENALQYEGGRVTLMESGRSSAEFQWITNTVNIYGVHALTASDGKRITDSNAGSSALNATLKPTGAKKALPPLGVGPKKETTSAFVLRVPTGDVSISKMTKNISPPQGHDLNKSIVLDRLATGQNSEFFHGVFQMEVGLFTSDAVKGKSATAVVTPESVRVKKVKRAQNSYMLKYLSWYDNEWGFASRVADLIWAAAVDIQKENKQKISENDALLAKTDSNGSGADKAMATRREGGINLDSAMMTLDVESDGLGVQFNSNVKPLLNVNFQGLHPVIIRSVVMPNLLGQLGLLDNELPTKSTDVNEDPRDRLTKLNS